MLGNGIGSIHDDVLHAIPTNHNEKLNLLNELKNRAKGCLASKNYFDAVKLYNKAIEVDQSNSILFANRSMCHLNMGAKHEALSDANSAIRLDPSYAKAYYRKAASLIELKDYRDAKVVILDGLNLLPSDKDFKTLLDKVEKLIANDINTSNGSLPSKNVEKKSFPMTSKNEVKVKPPVSTEDMEESAEDIADNLRGYKKTADGKLTTYFNNTLDDQTKALIGDIAPKKIDSTATTTTTTTTGSHQQLEGGSVWNAAGTWEERVHTPWATQRLRELLANIKIEVPSTDNIGGGEVSITSVKSIEGDAQVTMARGKRKHIYDFKADLEWSLTCKEIDIQLKGNMTVQDISGDFEYEIVVEIDRSSTAVLPSSPQHQLFLTLVKSKTNGIQPVIINALKLFHSEFKEK